jgi:hypothetical protein
MLTFILTSIVAAAAGVAVDRGLTALWRTHREEHYARLRECFARKICPACGSTDVWYDADSNCRRCRAYIPMGPAIRSKKAVDDALRVARLADVERVIREVN